MNRPRLLLPILTKCWWIIPIAVAALLNWGHRNEFKPDALAYLEAGINWWAWDLDKAVTGYWNPLFPIVISSVARFATSPVWEPLIMHITNFVLFILLLISFTKLIRELQSAFFAAAGAAPADSLTPPFAMIALGVSSWMAHLLKLQYAECDTLMAIWVVWTLIFAFRIQRAQGGWKSFAGLGFALGLGYLTKSVVFLLAPVFIFCVFLSAPREKRWTGLLLACSVYALLAAPYILLLSKNKGRWTFGDNGRVAYAFEVNEVAPFYYSHWQGDPPGSGTPVHPTRKILDDPQVFEFDRGRPGSYPLWYDASYWMEGNKIQFIPRKQIARLAQSAKFYLELILKDAGCSITLFTILFFALLPAGSRPFTNTRAGALFWLPTLCCLTLYALVYIELRYVAVFLSTTAAWALIRFYAPKANNELRESPPILIAYGISMSVAMLLFAIASAGQSAREPGVSMIPHQRVAAKLAELGVQPGDKIGMIGRCADAYFARYARAQIITDAPNQGSLRTKESFARAVKAMDEQTAAKAVVTSLASPEILSDTNWIAVAGAPGYAVQRLSP